MTDKLRTLINRTRMIFIIVFSFAVLAASRSSYANAPKLLVAPSSTTVALGKASLTVAPLIHEAKAYVGRYDLKVSPYFFKSEKGNLELEAPEDTVGKLLGGTAVEFTGKATNAKNGQAKVVTGKITPSTNDAGKVTFWVETDNGRMVFETSYRLRE